MRTLLALGAVFVGMFVGSLPASARARAHCHLPRRARITQQTRRVVLWRVPRHSRYGEEIHLVGCFRPTGRRTLLQVIAPPDQIAPQDTPEAVGRFLISGSFLASADVSLDQYGMGQARIVVVDLRSGRSAFDVTTHTFHGDIADQYSLPVLALSARGFVAWQDEQDDPAHSSGHIVVHDSHGTRTVDSSGPKDFSGLKVVGETASWKNQGKMHIEALG